MSESSIDAESHPGSPPRARRLISLAAYGLMLLPALVYLVNLPSFGELQYNDYYAILNIVVDGDEVTTDFTTWLTLKSNEHTVTLPALVYLANIALTDGDNRGLSVFGLFLLLTEFALLLRLLRPQDGWRLGEKVGVGFTLACFVFTPVITHSVIMGFSGTIWFFSNLCSVAAVVLLVTGRNQDRVWPAAAIALIGAFVYSTNFSLWPALFLGALLLRFSWKKLLILVAAGGVVLAYNALTYQPLPWHPDPNTSNLPLLAGHTFVYLGNVLASEPWAALLAGVIGCCLSMAVVLVLWRDDPATVRTIIAPWVMLQLYVLGNAIGTAVGRSGFGAHQALSSRYGSLTALFWIALLALMLEIVRRRKPVDAMSLLIPIGTAAVAIVATVDAGLPTLEAYLDRAARQPLAAQALRLGVDDPEALRILTPAPHQIGWVEDFLRASGHVPFDREETLPSTKIDLGSVDPEPPSNVRGNFDGFDLRGSSAARLQGWVHTAGAGVEIVVIDDRGRVLGTMVHGLPRSDVARVVGPSGRNAGCAGFIRLEGTPIELSTIARLRGADRWFRLPNRHVLPAAVPGGEPLTAGDGG